MYTKKKLCSKYRFGRLYVESINNICHLLHNIIKYLFLITPYYMMCVLNGNEWTVKFIGIYSISIFPCYYIIYKYSNELSYYRYELSVDLLKWINLYICLGVNLICYRLCLPLYIVYINAIMINGITLYKLYEDLLDYRY